MGTDKLSMEVDGLPLVDRVYGVVAAKCREVLVVGGGPAPTGARRVTTERPDRQGPLAGIEAGLAAAKRPLVFVAAGDMPFLSGPMVGYLLERLERVGADAVVPRYGGVDHPLCAAYARPLLPRVGAAIDEEVRSVRVFLRGLDRVEYVEDELRRFGDPDLLLMNVNTPEDLQRARSATPR